MVADGIIAERAAMQHLSCSRAAMQLALPYLCRGPASENENVSVK